jgi:membrane associated rhomboid family serine protease
MLFLWIYGNNIEDYFGPVKFLTFYLIAGLVAVAVYTLPNIDSQIPLVGASGAIAGVMGAYIILHPKAEITCLLFLFFITFVTLPAKVVLGLWFAYQLILTVLDSGGGGGVAYLAHVGGFVFGFVALWLIVKIRGKGSTPDGGQRVYRVHW